MSCKKYLHVSVFGGHNTKVHALADARGRLLAILLTGGEAHDCPAERFIATGKASKRLISDKAYDSAELRLWWKDRGTKPVIANRNRKQPFSFNRRLYKERRHIENAFGRLKDFRRIAATTGWRVTSWPLSASSPLSYGGLMSLEPRSFIQFLQALVVEYLVMGTFIASGTVSAVPAGVVQVPSRTKFLVLRRADTASIVFGCNRHGFPRHEKCRR